MKEDESISPREPGTRCRTFGSWTPPPRTLDVFTLSDGKWVLSASFAEDDRVRAEPFVEIEFELSNLWLDEATP